MKKEWYEGDDDEDYDLEEATIVHGEEFVKELLKEKAEDPERYAERMRRKEMSKKTFFAAEAKKTESANQGPMTFRGKSDRSKIADPRSLKTEMKLKSKDGTGDQDDDEAQDQDVS